MPRRDCGPPRSHGTELQRFISLAVGSTSTSRDGAGKAKLSKNGFRASKKIAVTRYHVL